MPADPKCLAGVSLLFFVDEHGKLSIRVSTVNVSGRTPEEHSTILDSNPPSGSQVERAQAVKVAMEQLTADAAIVEHFAEALGVEAHGG